MNGVLGALDLLLEDRLDPNQERLAATARDASEALRVLLDDLLDYSALKRASWPYRPQVFPRRA
ncbi:histidine kinase dimerization/phospho-acceptor domain-containing protein [Iodidimonas gelatinilytica]|nr:histidine kinase dimerization/phospho-acceptor domain-containing protein [Iodidimonas gelatinilytica]